MNWALLLQMSNSFALLHQINSHQFFLNWYSVIRYQKACGGRWRAIGGGGVIDLMFIHLLIISPAKFFLLLPKGMPKIRPCESHTLHNGHFGYIWQSFCIFLFWHPPKNCRLKSSSSCTYIMHVYMHVTYIADTYTTWNARAPHASTVYRKYTLKKPGC